MIRSDSSAIDVPAARYASTAHVAQAIGVSVTTVKRWVDDGVLPAHRTAGGHRKLLLNDVVRLIREGHLPQADLSQLDPRASNHTSANSTDVTEKLVDALKGGDGPVVRRLLHSAYRGGTPVEALADGLIAPALGRIGHQWSTGEVSVHQEHRGTQIVKAALYELKAQIEANAERGRPVAVGGAVEGDFSELPSLLAQIALLDVGWDAVNLGPHTPLASLTAALTEFRPRLVWVSVSHLVEPKSFAEQYANFYRAAQANDVAVTIGGRGLPPDVRAAIPYTTHGDGLTHLVAFARTLHPRPRRPRRGRPPGK